MKSDLKNYVPANIEFVLEDGVIDDKHSKICKLRYK